jgi:16S rRNA (cytosine967-C5)-methyltransferase
MKRPETARGLALQALREVDEGARANVVVPRLLGASRLERRDRHLVTELVYGACRMQRACDWLTGQHTRGRIDAEVRAALRLGAYQLGWTRIPPHAAVSATVDEVRGPGRTVVNAVLRRVATDVVKGIVSWPNAATELSYPDWVLDRLITDLGRQPALDALRTMNEPAAATPRSDGYIQDRGSQMVAEHLGPLSAGGTVLDMCAAPGGKSTGLAGPGTSVVAADLSLPRARIVVANADRLGARGVATVVADGNASPFRPASFDLVLVDAPCSGLGVLRRRPDARWRVQPTDVDRLSALQRRLLLSAASLVRPGGVLAYSVCTLTSTETAAIDRWMARELPTFTPVAPPGDPWVHAGRGALLLPQAAGTDGMFLLALRAPTSWHPDPTPPGTRS